uniref:ribonuclease H n=1 Tax=Schistocephalus solidus TaxID=70667 RepID=A0A0X3NWH0_SCHSO
MPFYAVAVGRKTGVFTKWSECQEQITGFSGAIYKKFNTESEAKSFLGGLATPSISNNSNRSTKRPLEDASNSITANESRALKLPRGSGSAVCSKVQDVLPIPFMHGCPS